MSILGNKSGKMGKSYVATGLEGWLKTRGLAGWLEIATDDLAQSANERITREIEPHFADSVEVHLKEGKSDEAARAAALAQLGDPTKAAADFRKKHLTEDEDKLLQSLARRAAKPLLSPIPLLCDALVLIGLVFLVSFLRKWHLSWVFVFPPLVAFSGYRLIPRWLFVRIPAGASYFRWLALSNILINVGFALSLSVAVYSVQNDLSAAFLGLWMGCTTLLSPGLRDWKIWRKLRKSPDGFVEMPPTQAAS